MRAAIWPRHLTYHFAIYVAKGSSSRFGEAGLRVYIGTKDGFRKTLGSISQKLVF